MTPRCPIRALAVVVVLSALLSIVLTGCRGRDMAQPLRPVVLPELARMDSSVQVRIREREAATRRNDDNPSARADAFGELGKILMAGEFYEAATPSFLNAEALAPSDRRWPYYLGHVYRLKGDLGASRQAFERARVLAPNDEATLVWLGNVFLQTGRVAEADNHFAAALVAAPRSAAAAFGLGRAALARDDYRLAVDHLERALLLDPAAVAIHYPLGTAYARLGEAMQAEAHLKQRGDGEYGPSDPLMAELGGLLQSPLEYEIAGDEALGRGDWAVALRAFRAGVERTPSSATLRHKLGTALALSGDVAGAMSQFEESVRLSPDHAQAQYSLGVLLASSGQTDAAIARLSDAVRADPAYLEARVALADTLRRAGRSAEAMPHYAEAVRRDPRNQAALFGSALALARLSRYDEAAARLSQGVSLFPDQLAFGHSLARVLAAAPDEKVREPRRAIEMTNALLKQEATLDLGETMAMALSNLGQYEEAASWQRDVVAAAARSGDAMLIGETTARLRVYESRRPVRTLWGADPELSISTASN